MYLAFIVTIGLLAIIGLCWIGTNTAKNNL